MLPLPAEGKSIVWILSEFGKPIFSSTGQADELCTTFALIQVLVRRYESWEDSLLSIQMPPDVYIQFSHRSPLILCIVSRHPYNLAHQLDIVYNQVISVLTKWMLKEIYVKMGDNFDLRRYWGDLDKRVDACVKGFNEDPVVFLSGFRVLPLNPNDREFIVSTMASAINELSPENVVFGILVVHRQLVAMVRMKRIQMMPSDFNDIVVNTIECHSSLREGENCVPICLPIFNQNSFLYAYISYLWEGTGPCLLLMSTKQDAFFALRSVRTRIEESMIRYKRCQLRVALSHPEPFSLKQVGSNELWHFMYKNTVSMQVCCSSPQIPYIANEELLSLYKGYFKLTSMLRKAKNVKMFFLTLDRYSLFSWLTSNFELHCTFSPLVTQSYAMNTAEKMLRLFRNEEKRVFFSIPSVLNG